MGDLACLYHVSVRTARRWAAQDGWRRTTARPVRYSVADAQASYDKRHGDGATAERVRRHLMRQSAISSEANGTAASRKLADRP